MNSKNVKWADSSATTRVAAFSAGEIVNGDYQMTFEDSDDWDEHPRNSRTFRYLCGHCAEDLLPENTDCYEARRKLYEYLMKLPCNHEIGANNVEG